MSRVVFLRTIYDTLQKTVPGEEIPNESQLRCQSFMYHDTTTLARYVPDLAQDRFHVWITKYHYLPITALGVLLLTIGGLPLLLWGVFLRTVVGLHATWLVNSATDIWGSRRFRTRDDSTNNWLVALLTFGEGWHNNHHAHPSSARHGFRWYGVDMNWYGIWMLKVFGLAKQIKLEPLGPLFREDVSGAQSRLTATTARHSQKAAAD